MAILGFELEEIARLLALVEAERLDEFIVEEAGRYLRIRGPHYCKAGRVSTAPAAEVRPASSAPPAVSPLALPAPPRKTAAPAVPAALTENQVAVLSPMVGVFYRSDKPGSPPFVEVGQHIHADQTIGLIEAMKVFSEIKAEHAGNVVAIVAKEGGLIQIDAPILIIERD